MNAQSIVTERLLDLVIEERVLEAEVGQLIHAVADRLGCDYFSASKAIRSLEDLEFIVVHRWDHDGHRYAGNRLWKIEVA